MSVAEGGGSIEPEGFQVLYEEGPCLVVDKPGGLPTQAPAQYDSLEKRLKDFLRLRDQKPGNVYLGLPHRLDRPVSGVIVFAKHVRAARRLAEQFQNRTVQKKYWALVHGRVTPDQGVWTDYLRKIPDRPQVETVGQDDPEGKLAVLRYRVLAHDDLCSWLEIEPETGRMHQIRIQAASRSHPVLGDELYGSPQPFGPPVDDLRQCWIALHARRLRFRHPKTQDIVVQTAPLPQPWRALEMCRDVVER
jgi:23S rRNA pseudouridine1911/1915/1917 synthase